MLAMLEAGGAAVEHAAVEHAAVARGRGPSAGELRGGSAPRCDRPPRRTRYCM
jgi:hypothetical protein